MEENQDYQNGFNNAYILAQHKPELYASIANSLSPANDYLEGFSDGGKQYELDLSKGILRFEKEDRNKDRDKDHEIDIDL